VHASRRVVQPANRGTLAAVLASLLRIVREDPFATIAFFPSDHDYNDDRKFMAGVDLAFGSAEINRDSVILLAVPAKHAEPGYSWIEAEAAPSEASRSGLLRVKKFWEKPSTEVASQLLERGCVWNTFVMVGSAAAFVNLIRSQAPELFQRFEALLSVRNAEDEPAVLREVYQDVADADFSRLVLASSSQFIDVLCLGDVGWTDLGEPARVIDTLSKKGVQKEWACVWQEQHASAAAC